MGNAKFGIKKIKDKDHVGEIRQSQLISMYGVGSIVNFVKDTVIIAGVDDWENDDKNDERKIYNDNLQTLTGANYFLEPKISDNFGFIKSHDILAYKFPEMLYCPSCKKIVSAKEAANANPKKKNKCFMIRQDGKPCTGNLIASRFVVACENGHLEDFPYNWWIHGNKTCVTGKKPIFSLFNIENRSDIESLFLRCENCGISKCMEHVFSPNCFSGADSYRCNSNHPHLATRRSLTEGECNKPLKTMLRSSSGVYFPVTVSALSIPPWSREAVKIIEREYKNFGFIDNAKLDDFLKTLTTPTVNLSKLQDALKIVNARKGTTRNENDIYLEEYKVLSSGATSDDEGEYSAFIADIPQRFKKFIKQITVVNRLTVVQALKGFTRIYPWSGGYNFNENANQKISPLSSQSKEWLPAIQLRGEGIFILFHDEIIQTWKSKVKDRYVKMKNNLEHSLMLSRLDRFSAEYVFLHTFAHLLIRQLANECGYSATSLKEKIYSTFNNNVSELTNMNGILIYLATSDCDGSLGGLISIAQNKEQFESILENMLHKASWCSTDPLCITSTDQGVASLNYSACHDCVLLPETSCEFFNVLLDRVAIVGTSDEPELGLLR